MAVSVVKKQEHSEQAQTPVQRETIAIITFDASYPSGGELLAAADFGFTHRIDAVIPIGDLSGYEFDFDVPNQKLLVYYGDNNAVSDGALIEVPDTTDLNTLAVRCLLKGW